MTRHVVKLSLLLPGLAFLAWWGWSGNFAFNQGDFYRLADQERFFQLFLGESPMGWARREVATDPGGDQVAISEETLINLPFGEETLSVKTFSTTRFDNRGRLVSAEFNIPLGDSSAVATAVVRGGSLYCKLVFGDESRDASIELPERGPVVVSGLVPWLGHQRELPLGRPLELSILDPVAMAFKPASLTIEDDTAESEEVQTWKLTLKFMSAESVEWVDSDGLLVGQYNPALDATFLLVGDSEEAVKQAREALSAPATPLPSGLIGDLISQALSGAGGLDGLTELFGAP